MTKYQRIKLLTFTISLLSIFLLAGCKNSNEHKKEKLSARDYITVGEMMDTIKPPYIVDVSNGDKRIVFIGCDHNNDSTHPQFKIIEKYAKELRPQISFNEGGQIADSIHYASVNDGAAKDGETGVLKYCADKLQIKMMNGDISFKTEWPLTLKSHSKEELYIYYVMERFVIPHKYGAYGNKLIDSIFAQTTVPYLLKNNFPLSPAEQSFTYFKSLYKKNLQKDFDSTNPDIEAFDYVNDSCKFCAVGRTSKMVRDSMLIGKIETALKTNNRILVTFGHGHALALEPVLKQLLMKKND